MNVGAAAEKAVTGCCFSFWKRISALACLLNLIGRFIRMRGKSPEKLRSWFPYQSKWQVELTMAFVCGLIWQDFSGSISSQYLQLNVKSNKKKKLQVGMWLDWPLVSFFYFNKLFENDILKNHKLREVQCTLSEIYQRKTEVQILERGFT